MKRITPGNRMLLAAFVAALAVFPLAQLAHAGAPAPDVPADIAVPAGHKPFLFGHAVGVQIWTCSASGWSFVAPLAVVYDHHGKLLTTHFAGPRWQAKDGSVVRGALEKGVTVDSTAIAWLRLRAASTAPGEDGDRLTGTTYIQRIATVGGIAPAASLCDAGSLGETVEVPYTADYVFWKAIDS